ncbi:MAG TPA: DNA alkylation repair protein [Longilinea sp.]|nr:DNA alkylation repair protein [Longilinea sp.]
MPAAQLSRLRIQINDLAGNFNQPAEFLRGLKTLLDWYSDRVYHPGQAVPNDLIIPHYHLPALILRQLRLDLLPIAQVNAASTLAICDKLWSEEYYEIRLMATYFLGVCPLDPVEEVTQRLIKWCKPNIEKIILPHSILDASARLRKEQPEIWLALARQWLKDADILQQRIGLQSLLPLISDEEYHNLPLIYEALIPTCRQAASPILSELSLCLQGLLKRSPVETSVFIQTCLEPPTSPAFLRLIRRLLPSFPPTWQAELRQSLIRIK